MEALTPGHFLIEHPIESLSDPASLYVLCQSLKGMSLLFDNSPDVVGRSSCQRYTQSSSHNRNSKWFDQSLNLLITNSDLCFVLKTIRSWLVVLWSLLVVGHRFSLQFVVNLQQNVKQSSTCMPLVAVRAHTMVAVRSAL